MFDPILYESMSGRQVGRSIASARRQKAVTEHPEHGLPQQVERFERAVIREELRRNRGDQTAAATALGIARQTLHDKLRKLGIAAEDFR